MCVSPLSPFICLFSYFLCYNCTNPPLPALLGRGEGVWGSAGRVARGTPPAFTDVNAAHIHLRTFARTFRARVSFANVWLRTMLYNILFTLVLQNLLYKMHFFCIFFTKYLCLFDFFCTFASDLKTK